MDVDGTVMAHRPWNRKCLAMFSSVGGCGRGGMIWKDVGDVKLVKVRRSHTVECFPLPATQNCACFMRQVDRGVCPGV